MSQSIKGLLAFILCVLVITSNAQTNNQKLANSKTPVSVNGKLQVIGTQLCNENSKPVVLAGISFGWHCFWPKFYNESTVNWLVTDWKCNVVRAAMGVGPKNSYLQNPSFALKCVTTVVDAAIKNGIYVLIDFHSHELRTNEAKGFFTKMANKYKDSPNVIYEIYNEPVGYSWKEVKQYSEEVIATIRSIDADNIILVGSTHWDQDVDSVAANPILGQKNIMYTMHFYAGTHKKWLRDRTEDAMNKGVPIFISECAGMDASGNQGLDVEEWNVYLDWMKTHKLSWLSWSMSNKEETCSMIPAKSTKLAGWKENELKEWGRLSRQAVRNCNQD